jgi:hypothetical protein
VSSSSKSDDIGLAVMGLGIGAAAFLHGFKDLKLKRTIEALATSKVRSMAMGTVELSGRAELLVPLLDPIFQEPCAFFQIRVEEQRGTGRNSRWVTLFQSDSLSQPFLLTDETGAVPVMPAGVELYCREEPGCGWASSVFGGADPRVAAFLSGLPGRTGSQTRLSAHILRRDEPVYVLGFASPLDAPMAVSAPPGEKLPEVIAALVARSPDGLLVISDRSERELLSQLETSASLKVFGGPILAVACAAYLARRLHFL